GDEASIILLMAFALWQRFSTDGMPWQEIPWWLCAAFLALPAVGVVSALVNVNPLTTLDHMRYHYRIFLPFALLPALAYVNLRRLFGTYAVCLGLMAVYGMIQYRYGVDWFRPEGQKLITPYLGGVFNAKGNFTHHLTYAGFMLINVPFFLSLAIATRGRERWAWGATSALAAIATLVSLGRSGWLGMAVGVLVLAVILLPRRWGVTAAVSSAVVIVVMAILLATGWLNAEVGRNAPPIVKRLTQTSFIKDVDRLRLWESGWLAFEQKPLLGHGWGNQDPALEPFRQQVSQKYGGYQFAVKASAGLHNIYLQMAFAVGAIGLIAYLYLWGAVFVWCAQGIARAAPEQAFERALLCGIAAGLAGSMAGAWFENNFLDGEVQALIMMMMGLAFFAGSRIRAASAGKLPKR
ncbi:MAG TPA: O-antigen ligase family protein, partial [bacterium]